MPETNDSHKSELPKINSVIVAIDDRPSAADALRLGSLIAGELGIRLGVATALEYVPLPIEDGLNYEEALEEHFERRFAVAEQALGTKEFDRLPLHGRSPARALTELAETENPDLLVLGSTHRSRLGRVLPGSTAERFLTGAPCAVAVAPRGFADGKGGLGKIIVGYDVSDESAAAVAWAEQLAVASGAALELIAVVHPLEILPGRLGPAGAAHHELLREEVENSLATASGNLDPGLETSFVVVDGDAADVLVARSAEADLLIVGSRAYGPARRTLLGGVSAHALRAAKCAVLVVPRPDDRLHEDTTLGAIVSAVV